MSSFYYHHVLRGPYYISDTNSSGSLIVDESNNIRGFRSVYVGILPIYRIFRVSAVSL